MEKWFNYSILFKQALQKIKCVRNPHANDQVLKDLKWDDLKRNVVFNFCDGEHEKYERIISEALNISLSCLKFIILKLGEIYNCNFSEVDIKIKEDRSSKVYFTIKDQVNNTLLLFKELEEWPGWSSRNNEPREIQNVINETNSKSCKYIYMVHENAFLREIGHNDNKCDPGRGYNSFGIKWFWEEYFSKEEYKRFLKELNIYIKHVGNYLGYTYIKTLNNSSLINFRKIMEHEITTNNYDILLNISLKDNHNNNYSLNSCEYEKIRKQFFDEQVYLVLMGNHDFSESLITAEWLYSSMKQAKAIDLTVIGTGYFKAVEQLLYELICLHKDEGREIKKNKSKNNVLLTQENIEKKDYLNTSLGSIANFYKNNIDILRSDIGNARNYVRETIFTYAKVRNGYFHKNNIHKWKKIDEIRTATFQLMFLILGSQNLTIDNRNTLGQLDISIFDDYYKLCEYVNYHSNEFFILNFGEKNELYRSVADMQMETNNNDYIKYSGVYFTNYPYKNNGKIIRLTRKHLPINIYTAKLIIANTEQINLGIVKDKNIFENGKFIGPSIVEEDKFSY